jgi:hypothetical protein
MQVGNLGSLQPSFLVLDETNSMLGSDKTAFLKVPHVEFAFLDTWFIVIYFVKS